jgi:hypothetical protein
MAKPEAFTPYQLAVFDHATQVIRPRSCFSQFALRPTALQKICQAAAPSAVWNAFADRDG